jgi:anti-sigma regulatory factor (Ser/Thr protein kinase)
VAVTQAEKVRRFVLRHVGKHPADVVRLTMDVFGVSRTAVLRQVNRLLAEGSLRATGLRKARRYKLTVLAEHSMVVSLEPGLAEHDVWNEHIAPFIRDRISAKAYQICQYGFTEMLNNAIDHSGGGEVVVGLILSPATVHMVITDDGVGIFRKITEALQLDDERHAILELSKGKFTTDPRRHSGEGIYFTTRAFDEFVLASGKLTLLHLFSGSDWLVDSAAERTGTQVEMIIDTQSSRYLPDVFKKASAPDDPGFSRTNIPVDLALYGDDNLVSRSQAKRLLMGLDRFKEIVLDFKNVGLIGQAFADEIFRVFTNEHPDVHIVSINANDEVRSMIAHVKAGQPSSAP